MEQFQSECSFFSIDCNRQLTDQNEDEAKRSNSSHSNTSDSSLTLSASMTKISDTSQFNNPFLTRTEEKSLANEFFYQFPIDISVQMAEEIARRRFCEIIFDNYSCRILPETIPFDWFYDFLLRNPRLPIHFQSWFSSIPLTLPATDQMVDIKIWELGLVTRSTLSLSSSSSP